MARHRLCLELTKLCCQFGLTRHYINFEPIRRFLWNFLCNVVDMRSFRRRQSVLVVRREGRPLTCETLRA
jgi:hypothetical protein